MTAHEHKHHIVPLSTYFSVATALFILTIVTVWVASVHLGSWNMVVALLVAATKGSLVALIFMHLRYEKKILAVVFVGALAFLAIFIIFTMFDTMTRGELGSEVRHPINPAARIYQMPAAVAADSMSVDSMANAIDSTVSKEQSGHE
ncbi:MAG: cytochrome C oxidase subunit IV family protein [Candidatus Zixiibacteriota bacterium]